MLRLSDFYSGLLVSVGDALREMWFFLSKFFHFSIFIDLRFLSIDFLNTFLLTYRVFTDGETVLNALKKVFYDPPAENDPAAEASDQPTDYLDIPSSHFDDPLSPRRTSGASSVSGKRDVHSTSTSKAWCFNAISHLFRLLLRRCWSRSIDERWFDWPKNQNYNASHTSATVHRRWLNLDTRDHDNGNECRKTKKCSSSSDKHHFCRHDWYSHYNEQGWNRNPRRSNEYTDTDIDGRRLRGHSIDNHNYHHIE